MSGDVFYYGMHVLGIIAIIIYIAIISPKFNESRFLSIVCGMLSYATIYALMLFLFYLVTGVFGGQNVIRTFIFLPLIIIAYSKLLRLNTRHLLDMLAPCIPMAQVLGKIGCQYVGCCQSWLRVDWGIINPITNERLFPIQLIEGIVALLVVIIVIVYMRKKNYQANGLAMPLSMLLFGGSRFFLEFLRDNEKVIGNISELALWCVAMVIVSIIWIAIYKSKEKKESLS